MAEIHPKSELRIVAKAPLSHTHMHALSLLYQPIIGQDAFGLYTALHALIDKSNLKTPAYPHAFFFDMLKLTPNQFLAARQKLEAVGLIETYKTNDGFTIELYLPFSAEGFIKDSPFGIYLKNQIGPERFDDLVAHFKISRRIHKTDKNVSVRFDEVFQPVYQRIESRAQFTEDESKKAAFTEKIDLEIVLGTLPDNMTGPKLKTKKTKEKLEEIAYIYQLQEADMQTMLKQSIKQDKTIDFDVLIKHAQNHYQKQTPRKIRRKNDPYNLTYFQSVHPKTLLEEATGSKAAAVELRTLERLITESGLKHEVINVLIAYVLKELDNDFPSYNYFDKVAATWKRNGVKTAEDAIEQIKARRNKAKTTKYQTGRRGREKPIDTNVDWFDDYLKKQGGSS